MNRKRILLWTVLAGGAAAAAQWLPDTLKTPTVAGPAVAETAQASGPSDVVEPRWAALPKREGIGKPGGEIFLRQSWTPPRPPRRAIAAQPPPEKPAPPAMPYRVAGKLVHDDRSQIVLAKADKVFMVREGDTLEDNYRVVAIDRDHVTLLYLPLEVRETVPVTSAFVIDNKFGAAAPDPLASR
jgi:hypothetical protein